MVSHPDMVCEGVFFNINDFVSGYDSLTLSSVSFWFGDSDTVQVAIQATNSSGMPVGPLIYQAWITTESSRNHYLGAIPRCRGSSLLRRKGV